jgi:hypothetical protein
VPRRQTSARGSFWWNSTISRTDLSDVKRAMLSRVSLSFVGRISMMTTGSGMNTSPARFGVQVIAMSGFR